MVVWWTETYCRRTATYRHCWRTCNVLALQPCSLASFFQFLTSSSSSLSWIRSSNEPYQKFSFC
jgi:hypothetical protein